MLLRKTLTPLAWLTLASFAAGQESSSLGPFRSVLDSSWRVEVEGGALWQSRNDVQIPGDTGTRFSLLDLTGSGAFPVGRLAVEWDMTERHGFQFVYAPLGLEGDGTLSQPTNFNGQSFTPGPASGSYRFDTYRLTWRYRFWQSEAWTWRAGLTALLRDAEIEVSQGATSSSKSNTGLVPLLHLSGEWRFRDRWQLLGSLDGSAAPQGRAVDLSLKLGYDLSDRWRIAGGYRTIEGGSDGDEVYTFAWVHSAVVSLTYGL